MSRDHLVISLFLGLSLQAQGAGCLAGEDAAPLRGREGGRERGGGREREGGGEKARSNSSEV